MSKDEWKEHKEIYSAECTRFKNAIEVLTQEIEDLLSNKGKRMKWVEHFKRFSTMTEIDRTAVIQLIKSIHVIDKTTIKITFNYKQEYDSALETLSNINIQREVV